MAAQTRTVLLCLAAFCLPALANVPRASLLSEKPHQGVAGFALASHWGAATAMALSAPGLCGCLYDSGRRSRSTGKERDAETGLDYFGARYMSSAQGRFSSPDPGNAGAEPEVPQSWNMYGYALNNPGKYVDPNGESPTLATAAIGAGIGFAVGGGGELFSQWRAGGSYNWQKIGAKGAGSAVFGFGIGLTGGASVAFTAGVAGGASLVGGVLERSLDGDVETDAVDRAELGSDFLAGAAGGLAGQQIQTLLKAKLPLPEWAKMQLRQAKRLRRVAKGRVDSRPASAVTLTQNAEGTEKFVGNVFFLWPASAARGGTKKVTKEIVNSTIRYFAPEEEKLRELK